MKILLLALVNIAGILSNAEAQLPTEKSLLWQVSGKGISTPSYLFGTIHLACPEDLKIPEILKEKFESTKQLFLEIDLDEPGMMMQMMKGMQMKDSTLEELLGNRYEKTSIAFQQITGMPLAMMKTTKPFMLMSLIYPSLLGCTPASWETVLQKMAKEKNMEVKGLESLADQINVFEKIPYKVQSEMLANVLINADSTKTAFREMMDLYKQQDIAKLNIENDTELNDYEGLLLKDRNHNWVPVIGEQAKKTPTFFAFGAAHLGGESGIINLLRKAGFEVKPVYF